MYPPNTAKDSAIILRAINKNIREKEIEFSKYPFEIDIEIADGEYIEWCPDTGRLMYNSMKNYTRLKNTSIEIRMRIGDKLDEMEKQLTIGR